MITVVSGTQRSGTSMMMNMLGHIGIPLLHDDHIKANEANPDGFFEYSAARMIGGVLDVGEAEGMAIKIHAGSSHYLKLGHEYRIIVMRRKMDEIYESFKRLHRARYNEEWTRDFESLERELSNDLNNLYNWIYSNNVKYVTLWYNRILNDTKNEMHRLIDTFGFTKDQVNAMVSVIRRK